MDYLQADVFAGPHLTVVGGEFLTPFGTYNERLTQIWIQTLPDFPLIYGVGTMNTGSGVGGMVRGSAFSNAATFRSAMQLTIPPTLHKCVFRGRTFQRRTGPDLPSRKRGLKSAHPTGGPSVGTHENFVGAHLWWEPINSPFRFRSEYAHAPHSQGYWFETDYRLSHFGGAESLFGRLEPVFRMQQTFRGKPDPNDGLPSVNTQRADFGLDYHLPHEVRINTSYSRQFSSNGDVNIWETAIVYRFLFPTWKGKGH